MTRKERCKVTNLCSVLKQTQRSADIAIEQARQFKELAIKALANAEQSRRLLNESKRAVNVLVILPTPEREA